jgi:hypothetical protein
VLRTVRIEEFAVVADGSADGALFAAGSISKAVTALLALLLVHDDVLHLDADVDGVTLRQLLGHVRGQVAFDGATARSFRYSGRGYVSALDGSSAVVMSDIHNGFAEVLPAVASALVVVPLR